MKVYQGVGSSGRDHQRRSEGEEPTCYRLAIGTILSGVQSTIKMNLFAANRAAWQCRHTKGHASYPKAQANAPHTVYPRVMLTAIKSRGPRRALPASEH